MLPQKIKILAKIISNWTKKIEEWENVINKTSVLVAIVIFISWGLQKEGKLKSFGEEANEAIHYIHIVCVSLIILLQTIFRCLKIFTDESQKVANAIKKLTIDNLDNADKLFSGTISDEEDEYRFEYTKCISDIAKFEQKGGHLNFLDENYFLKEYLEYHKEIYKTMSLLYRNGKIKGSAVFLRMKNDVHFKDHNSEVNFDDTTLERTNTLCLHKVSLIFKYFRRTSTAAIFMNCFCRHAAESLCTKNKRYTDIFIYARLKADQEDYARILLAIGFECEPDTNCFGKKTYVLNFGKKQDNIFVDKIFSFMKGDIGQHSVSLN